MATTTTSIAGVASSAGVPNPLGIGSHLVHGVLQVVLGGLAEWIASGAASLIATLGQVLDTTTSSPFGSGFTLLLQVMDRLGLALALPFLLLTAIQSILRQDVGILLRTLFIRVPVALVAGGAAMEAVVLGLQATDALGGALLASAGGAERTLLSNIIQTLSAPGLGGPGLAGFAGVVIALLAALVAFVLWLELVLREAAIALAALFIPLVLAAIIWPVTSHWARRLAEAISALVLAKFVIVAVLALSAATVGTATGPSGVVEGTALFLLAAAAPFALLRLIPLVEAGAIAHLEGTARRIGRAGRLAAEVGAELLPVNLPDVAEAEIPMAAGSTDDPDEVARFTAQVQAQIAARDRALDQQHDEASERGTAPLDERGADGERD